MYKFKRKGLMVLLMVCLLSITFKVTNVYAEEGILVDSPVEVSSDVAINSKYIWRGFKLDDDPVMQPGIYISAYGFTASIWGSFDMDNDDSLNSEEVDYCIDYTYEIEKLSLSAGHTYYDFPAGDCASKEIYIGAGLDVLLSPSLTWYHDYADEDSGGGDGDYVELGLSHSFSLGDSPLSLELGGHLGYNNELFINGKGGDAALSVGLTIPLTEKASLSPSINYSVPFGDLEDANDGNQDDEFYAGVTLAFSM